MRRTPTPPDFNAPPVPDNTEYITLDAKQVSVTPSGVRVADQKMAATFMLEEDGERTVNVPLSDQRYINGSVFPPGYVHDDATVDGGEDIQVGWGWSLGWDDGSAGPEVSCDCYIAGTAETEEGAEKAIMLGVRVAAVPGNGEAEMRSALEGEGVEVEYDGELGKMMGMSSNFLHGMEMMPPRDEHASRMMAAMLSNPAMVGRTINSMADGAVTAADTLLRVLAMSEEERAAMFPQVGEAPDGEGDGG